MASAVTPGEVAPPLSAPSSNGSTHGAADRSGIATRPVSGVAALTEVDVLALLLGLLEGQERPLLLGDGCRLLLAVAAGTAGDVVVVVTATEDDDGPHYERGDDCERPVALEGSLS
jgi:hypothetical protein